MPLIAPVRMRLSRAKGFDLQEASRAINGLPAVNCARPGRFGNPFDWREYYSGSERAARRAAAHSFQDAILGQSEWCFDRLSEYLQRLSMDVFQLRRQITYLSNHNLACWCPLPAPGEPDHCHAAVLLEIANR